MSFSIIRQLGEGSTGVVYLARHAELGDNVAIKVLRLHLASNEHWRARFKNEAFAAYSVNHPNVLSVYEYFADKDLVALSMEFAENGDLTSILNSKLSIATITQVLLQIARGLEAIHQAGLVHRNIKFENILLARDNQVKICDFCQAFPVGARPKAEEGAIVGTIDYVTPEYMRFGVVDWRTDIYALGIIGYELITGRSPFQGNSVYETMRKRLDCLPTAPSLLRGDCPRVLDQIILQALSIRPEDRYQSAADLANALEALGPM